MAEATPKKTKKTGGGFMKPVQPDATLAAVIGAEPLPRTQIIARIWDYIRSHKLQDPAQKTRINADEKLKAVFDGRDSVTMFEMTSLIFKHVK